MQSNLYIRITIHHAKIIAHDLSELLNISFNDSKPAETIWM